MPAVDVQCSLLDVEHVNLRQPAIRLMLEERTVFPDSWVDPLEFGQVGRSFIHRASSVNGAAHEAALP
jgi:hypothetical protein